MGDQTCSTRQGFNKYEETWWGISSESEHLGSMEGDVRTKYKQRIKLMKSGSTVWTNETSVMSEMRPAIFMRITIYLFVYKVWRILCQFHPPQILTLQSIKDILHVIVQSSSWNRIFIAPNFSKSSYEHILAFAIDSFPLMRIFLTSATKSKFVG